MIAARRGHAGCLGVVIGAGADMHMVNNDEPCTTALMLAARHHHPECVQLLLTAGVDVDQQSPEISRTALMYAAAAGQLPTVRLLIGAGADLSIRSAHGETALSLARSHGQRECAALLTGQFREQTRALAAILNSERALQRGASLLGSRVWSAE
jgi:ankyrin repeat protein